MQAKPEVMEVSVLQLEKCSSIVAAEEEKEKSKQRWDQVERTDCLKWRKFPEDWSWSEMQSRRRVVGG